MSTRDGRLEQFFGGYFHQDWDVEGATSWRDVIKHYAVNVPRHHVVTIRNDLQDWFNETAGDTSPNLPPPFGCDYNTRSDGLTGRQWVSEIVAEFDRLLQS
jgi:CdiI immunity protein